MLRKLYNRVLELAGTPHGDRWLAAVAFAESSFFPVPPDAMLVPMAIVRPDRAWYFAAVATIASVLGGIVGYVIGYALLDTVGTWLISLYGMQKGLEGFQAWYTEWGLLVILVKGLTPIPYKLVAIASGAAQFSLLVFVIASVVTRGARFFLVAGLLRYYGVPVRDFIERRLIAVTSIAALIAVGAVVALRFV